MHKYIAESQIWKLHKFWTAGNFITMVKITRLLSMLVQILQALQTLARENQQNPSNQEDPICKNYSNKSSKARCPLYFFSQ